jgi:hypothetical protein
VVPYSFFLKDPEDQLSVDPLGHDLLKPRCPTTSSMARRLEDRIYIVTEYEEGPDLPYSPCLIMPTPKGMSPP